MIKIKRTERAPIKVNTTALPDIIFMLLFFFMMTTTMQNQNLQSLELPQAYNVSTKDKTEDTDLEIYVSNADAAGAIQVNDMVSSMADYQHSLKGEVSRIQGKGIFIPKAYLYVDADTPMSIVNDIKSQLQSLNVTKVQYVHSNKVEG